MHRACARIARTLTGSRSVRFAKVVPKSIVIAGLGAVLQACGGGGGGDGVATVPPGEGPALGTGVFKDSNVTGLNYTSGSHSGVTAQDGSFTFEHGATTTFKIGAVTLGSTTGDKDLVTPIVLIAGGTSTTPAVLNMTRLLMMLDADGIPDNGITISANVQGRAATWTAVNFSDSAIDSVLANLSIDARSADAGLHTVPTSEVAQAHLESSIRCATSG